MDKKVIFSVLLLIAVVLGIVWVFLPNDDSTINGELEAVEDPGAVNSQKVEETTPSVVETSQEKLKALGGDPKNVTNEKVQKTVTLQEYESGAQVIFYKEGRFLNLDETIVEVFGPTIFEDSLSPFLSMRSFRTSEERTVDMEQKIEISEDLTYEEYSDDDYLNGTNATGLNIQSNKEILTYVLSFVQDLTWDELEGSYMWFFGRIYFVAKSDKDSSRIELLRDPYEVELKEKETFTIEYPTLKKKTFELDFKYEDSASFIVEGVEVDNLVIGKTYFKEGIYIFVKDITYSKNGLNSVDLILSPQKLVLLDGEVRDDDQPIKGFSTEFYPKSSEDLASITLTWKSTEELFLSAVDRIDIPFFKNMYLGMIRTSYDTSNLAYTNITLVASTFELKEI